MNELLTIDDVARFCQIHKATVRRHIASGRLRSVRVGRAVRVRKEDLDRFVGHATDKSQVAGALEVDSLPLPFIQGELRPFTLDDPLWEIGGMIDDPDGPDWISSDKHRALAEAYAPKS